MPDITNSARFYHVTTLSNFARGYDKYTKRYGKAAIPESTFPDQFFILKADELDIGLTKASRLLERLQLAGDRLIVLETRADERDIRHDHLSGVGQYLPQNYIELEAVHYLETDGAGQQKLIDAGPVENVTAASFAVLHPTLPRWDALTPRTVSVLPIAMACQASCRFCFSKASVSTGFERSISDWDRISDVMRAAKQAGAERAVITGGGEPTLLKPQQMQKLIGLCRSHFDKVVLITNAHLLGNMGDEQRAETIMDWDRAGLSVLSISRHHHDGVVNESIMGLDTKTENVLHTLTARKGELAHIRPRFICVLQKGGIATPDDVGNYLSWAAAQGVREVNFKELYVSTGLESAYADFGANAFSAANQIPLRVVHDFCARAGFQKTGALPWGAPVYRGQWQNAPMQIAAYTEPSVYWERTHGLVRSWNIMSDGTTLASLEDRDSEVVPRLVSRQPT